MNQTYQSHSKAKVCCNSAFVTKRSCCTSAHWPLKEAKKRKSKLHPGSNWSIGIRIHSEAQAITLSFAYMELIVLRQANAFNHLSRGVNWNLPGPRNLGSVCKCVYTQIHLYIYTYLQKTYKYKYTYDYVYIRQPLAGKRGARQRKMG